MISQLSSVDSKVVARSFRVSRSLISYQTIGLAVGAIEATVIAVGSALGQIAYDKLAGFGQSELETPLGLGLLAGILYVSIARSAGLYRLPTLISPGAHLKRIGGVCGGVLLALTAVLFLLKLGSDVSRGAMTGFAAFMLFLCGVARWAAAVVIDKLLASHAIAGRAAFVIGDADELVHLSPSYLLRHFGLREVGRLALQGSDARARAEWGQSIGTALDAARDMRAKEFTVVTKLDRMETVQAIREHLRFSPLSVKLVPNKVLRSVVSFQNGGSEVGDHLIELQRAPMGLPEQLVKRILDMMIASTALFLLLPIFVIAACAIKIDSSGPVIFRQRRNGFDQRPFTIFKFRSMSVMENGHAVVQAKRGDSRVTRVGQFLRRSSIDELPQLFNVLLGDMSIVGPRPHAMAHDDEYKSIIADYCLRHHVKPGITGWAQVNGFRGETARPELMQKRVDLDVWYVNNRSTVIDMRILFRTCFEVFGHEAY